MLLPIPFDIMRESFGSKFRPWYSFPQCIIWTMKEIFFLLNCDNGQSFDGNSNSSKCQLVTEKFKNRGHSNCLFHLSTGELSKSSLVSCKASATIGLKYRRAQCAVPRRAAYTTTTSLRRRRWRWTAAHCAWSKRLLPPKLCIYTWWCHLGLLSQFSNRP